MIYPGVVEQHVNLAEALQGSFDCSAALVSEAHIGADEEGLTAILNDGLDDLVPALGIAPGDGDGRSFACEALGRGPADSRRPARYQCYFSIQPHGLPYS
jgi:hypothetical protein